MLEKTDETTNWGSIITWLIIICLIVVGIYNMGKNSNKKLTPQEQQEDITRCYQWYGKEACDDPNFNPQ